MIYISNLIKLSPIDNTGDYKRYYITIDGYNYEGRSYKKPGATTFEVTINDILRTYLQSNVVPEYSETEMKVTSIPVINRFLFQWEGEVLTSYPIWNWYLEYNEVGQVIDHITNPNIYAINIKSLVDTNLYINSSKVHYITMHIKENVAKNEVIRIRITDKNNLYIRQLDTEVIERDSDFITVGIPISYLGELKDGYNIKFTYINLTANVGTELCTSTVKDCPTRFSVIWAERNGNIQQYPFEGNCVQTNNYEHLYSRTILDEDRKYSSQSDTTFLLNTDIVNDETNRMFEGIFVSKSIYLFDNKLNKMSKILITDTNFKIKKFSQEKKLYNLQLNVRLDKKQTV